MIFYLLTFFFQSILLINELLKEGLDLSTFDADGRSPLHSVVMQNSKYIHLASTLIENDAQPEATDAKGRLAVEFAIEAQADEMAALIIQSMSNAR